jgi:hypothetical protein
MALTLGFTGMDSSTEAALTAAFQQANARSGNAWQLKPDSEADHVIVDMDSMYGPMSWLRLHAAGKQVVGLTSAPRTQTDFHLARPFDADSIAVLLASLAEGTPSTVAGKAAPAPAPPATKPTPSGMSPSPVPQDLLPEEHPQPIDEEAEAPAPAPRLPASVQAGTLAPATIAPAPPAPAAEPPHAPPPRERCFADWLAPGMLSGRFRYRRATEHPILVDADARQYFSTTALKPLTEALDGIVARDDFQPVDAATWARESAPLGAAQPRNRLQWFGGLVAGKGKLLSEFDPAGRYKLSKWPQTEREFPKHFRIATAMMKGPATIDEIAAGSGVPAADVADFVNASLVSGYAEHVSDSVAEPAEPQKPGGLFGRLRGK